MKLTKKEKQRLQDAEWYQKRSRESPMVINTSGQNKTHSRPVDGWVVVDVNGSKIDYTLTGHLSQNLVLMPAIWDDGWKLKPDILKDHKRYDMIIQSYKEYCKS